MRKYSERMKNFQCLCILASLLLMLTSWINIDVSYDWSESFTYQLAMEYIEMRIEDTYGSEETEVLEKYYSSARAFEDGRLTPIEIFSTSEGIEYTVGSVVGRDTMHSFLIIYKTAMVTLGVLGILSLISLKRKKGLTWTEYLFLAAMLFFVWLHWKVEKQCVSILRSDCIKMSMMPYLAILFALPIGIKSKLPLEGILGGTLVEETEQSDSAANTKQSAMQNLKRKLKKEEWEEWTCKQCGKENLEDSAFCSQCGQPRPKKAHCVKCGGILEDEDMFCRKCGTPRTEETEDAKENVKQENEKQENEKQENVCKVCGSLLEEESIFCGNCGAKVNE